jgi:Spy/CpxP family protein refolding chaperone
MKNNILKTSVLLVLVTLLSFAPAMAQQPTSQPPLSKDAQRAQMFQEMVVRLKLNQEQEKQMRLIMKQSRNELKALKEANKDKPKAEKQKLLAEQMKKTDGQVNAILTDEQKVIWKQLKQEQKAKMMQKKEQQQKHKGASEMEEIDGIL